MPKQRTKPKHANITADYQPPHFTKILIRSQWVEGGKELLHEIIIDGDDCGSANSLGGLTGLLEPLLIQAIARKIAGSVAE